MSDDPQAILIDYTNHAGARQVREIRPVADALFFGNSQWHPEPQWLLTAWDFGKKADRTFAMKDIHRWGVQPDRQMQIDLSIARQLQQSMERNARMVNRLSVLAERAAKVSPGDLTPYQLLHLMTKGFAEAIDSIKRDEEPTWPVVLTK